MAEFKGGSSSGRKGGSNEAASFLKTTRTKLAGWRRDRPVLFYAGAAAIALLLLGALLVGGLVLAVYLGAFGALPSRADVAAVQTPEASALLDRDGALLARYYAENRELVDPDDIPPALVEALLATEDERFFEHHGVDWWALGRAVVRTGLLGQREQGGGSTLSQQLAKNHFPRSGGGKLALLVSKIKEGFTANRFEDEFSKEELITLYLNSVPFGENIYGVKVAARRFFGVEPVDLRTEQAAVLVGMLKANTAYNPVRAPERALARRNLVLRRMRGLGFLTEVEYAELAALPLEVNTERADVGSGASYFSERVRRDVEAMLLRLGAAAGEELDLNTDGLQIYTTLDLGAQRLAEEAVRATMAELQPAFEEHWRGREPDGFAGLLRAAAGGTPPTGALADSLRAELLTLRAGLVVADPETGDVLAYVGGTDFARAPFNGATARRQVGSTFKPIVYAAAFERDVQPCDYLPNELRTYADYDDWTPENSDGQYGGEYSVVGGLVGSVNTVAVQLAFSAGIRRVVALAEALGLEGVPAEPSIALGTPSLTLEEMVGVYAAFARHGTTVPLTMVTRIEDRHGRVLYEAPEPGRGERAISRRTAEVLDFALRQVAKRGTGAGLASRYGVRSEVAGKTGTTQNQADGWFLGYTADYAVGAWVGGQYPSIRWRSLRLGQGARTALPIVGRFVRAYERERGVTRLPELPEDILIDTECDDFLDLPAVDSTGRGFGEDFADIFRDIFERNRERRSERAERPSPPPRPRQRPQSKRRRDAAAANRELERRRRAREAQARERERDRRRAERRQRRREALEKIFGRPR